jgi:hypothetical protein
MPKFNWNAPVTGDATPGSHKKVWHSRARRALTALAAELGLDPDSYDLRTNYAGPAVCGESTFHSDSIYIQVSNWSMGPGTGILVRSCKGRRDYTGGHNHFLPLTLLDDPRILASEVRKRVCVPAVA